MVVECGALFDVVVGPEEVDVVEGAVEVDDLVPRPVVMAGPTTFVEDPLPLTTGAGKVRTASAQSVGVSATTAYWSGDPEKLHTSNALADPRHDSDGSLVLKPVRAPM